MFGNLISRQTKFKALAVVMSLILASLVFEVFLRLINYRPVLVDPNIYVANQSSLLPYKLRPNYDGYYLQQEVKIDGEGNRIVTPDAALSPTERKSPPARDIMVLGDSVVFGYGVSNENTIASQLQSLFFRKNLNYTVRNIGAPGYSSWNEYVALDDYLRTHSVSDVILIYIQNDITFDNDYLKIGQGKLAAFSDDRFHRFMTFLYSHFYTSYLIADTLKRIRSTGSAHAAGAADIAERNNQPAINYSMQALSQLNDLCRRKGIKFSVGIYRDAGQYHLLRDRMYEYESTIKKNLDDRGIASFVIKSHAENLDAAAAQVFWNDPHPSPQAIHFIAADLDQEIERTR